MKVEKKIPYQNMSGMLEKIRIQKKKKKKNNHEFKNNLRIIQILNED